MPSRAEAVPSFLWVEALPAAGRRLALGAENSHYLSRVCRARPGGQVTLTDGRGGLARARLVEVGARTVAEVEAVEWAQALRRATLLCGAPEGERADWMVEKLAELGIGVLQPIECQRATWTRWESKLRRWRRLATAALRQSHRRFLLEIRPPATLCAAVAALSEGSRRLVADAGGEPAARVRVPGDGDSVGAIGPAAGLIEAERASLVAAGFEPIALADGRLRTETAAIAWAVWWAAGG